MKYLDHLKQGETFLTNFMVLHYTKIAEIDLALETTLVI